MKKIILLIAVLCFLPLNSFGADRPVWLKDNILFKEAKVVPKEYETNSFAFEKQYKNNKVLVLGRVESVGKGAFATLEEMFDKKPTLPFMKFDGFFHAFLDKTDTLDLSGIQAKDYFFVYCRDLKPNIVQILGLCSPVMQFRGDKQIWVTSNEKLKEELVK